MKKLLALYLILALFTNNGFAAWDKNEPAGTRSISDIDLYVIANNTALESTLSAVTGYKNLAVSYVGATSLSVTADWLLLQAASSIAYRATSVSETITITTSGASGLVSSLSEASATWYYVWIARKSSDGTTNGYLSTASDLTTFLTQVDSGYDQAAVVSAVRNDGSSNFIGFKQTGRVYSYNEWQTMASGAVGSTAWVSIDTTAFIPSGLSSFASGSLYGGTYPASISNDNTASTGTTHDRNKIMVGSHSGVTGDAYWELTLLTANTLYWMSDSGVSGTVRVAGFEINKI